MTTCSRLISVLEKTGMSLEMNSAAWLFSQPCLFIILIAGTAISLAVHLHSDWYTSRYYYGCDAVSKDPAFRTGTAITLISHAMMLAIGLFLIL